MSHRRRRRAPTRSSAAPGRRRRHRRSGQPSARRLKLLLRSKVVHRRIADRAVLGGLRDLRRGAGTGGPVRHRPAAAISQSPSGDHWFGTDRLGRDVMSRVIVGARDILIVAPIATVLATVIGTALGSRDGVLPRRRRQHLEPLHRRLPGPADRDHRHAGDRVTRDRRRWTVIIVIAVVFAPLIARTVRAAVLQEREMEYVVGGAAAQRTDVVHPVRRDPPQRDGVR